MKFFIGKKIALRMISVLISIITVVTLLTPAVTFAGAVEPAMDLIILQTYGGGKNQSGTPISHSFIEIYNPTAASVDLSDYKIVYHDEREAAAHYDWEVTLSGTLVAGASYLIRGQALTGLVAPAYQIEDCDLDLPDNWLDNKEYSVKLVDSLDAIVNEMVYSGVPNKHTARRRIDLSGSDEIQIDYRSTLELEDIHPRCMSDGAWIPFKEPEVSDKNTPDDLIISMVYAGAIDSEGAIATEVPVKKSFVEIYNPTDETISLNGYYLHYQGYSTQFAQNRSGDTWDALALNPEKSIPPKHSYLIDCGNNESTIAAAITLTVFDQIWSPSPRFCTKGAKYVITYGVSSIAADEVNPFKAGGEDKPIDGYIDMFGVAGNDTGSGGLYTNEIDGYETAFKADSSKQRGFIRKDRNVDTDNNAQDFEPIDFRSVKDNLPRSLEDGEYSDIKVKDLVFDAEYAAVDKPFTVRIANSDPGETFSYSWVVGGENKNNNYAVYTPTSNDLEKFFEIKATSNLDGTVYENGFYFSTLPVLYINTENQKEISSKTVYINAHLRVQGNDEYNSSNTVMYTGATEIRGRGNNTWGKPKKPYKLKLSSKTDMFGMGTNKHWVMLAEYNDDTVMKNILSQHLAKETTDNFTPDIIPAVCVFNGRYDGVYAFGEQIRLGDNRLEIYNWEDTGENIASIIAAAENFSASDTVELMDFMVQNLQWITEKQITFKEETYLFSDYPGISFPDMTDLDQLGGYHAEIDNYTDEATDYFSSFGLHTKINTPEFLITNETFLENVQIHQNAFETALKDGDFYAEYNGKRVHYSELFDVQSLIEYYFVYDITMNPDFMNNSTHYYKEIGQPAHFGPAWDFDWSMGIWWGTGPTPTDRWALNAFGGQKGQNYYKYLANDPYFLTRMYEHLMKIRPTVLEDLIKSGGYLDQLTDKLRDPVTANNIRWPKRDSLDRENFDDAANLIKNQLKDKITWIDQQLTRDTNLTTLENMISSMGRYSVSSQISKPVVDVYETPGYVKVTAELKDWNSGMRKGRCFINGIQLPGDVEISSDNRFATFMIPDSYLEQDRHILNVVQIRALNQDGSYNTNGSSTKRSNYAVFYKVGFNELNELISECESVHSGALEGYANGQYEPGSKDEFQTAIEAAQAVADNTQAIQREIEDAISELQSAYEIFNSKKIVVDFDDLSYAILQAKGKADAATPGDRNGEYPQEAITAFEEAIDVAERIADNSLSTQIQVDDALSDLQEAIIDFDKAKIVVDYDDLNNAILLAKEKADAAVPGDKNGEYPQSAITAFEEAIEIAEEIADNSLLIQTQVDEALSDLQEAITAFDNAKIVIDNRVLNNLISSCDLLYDSAIEGTAKGEYGEGSKSIFRAAIDAAQLVADNDLVTKTEFDAAVLALTIAMEEFKAREIIGMLGDVNGDSSINIFDIMAIRDHIFGKNTLTGDDYLIADVNEDLSVNIFDIMAIRDHIFGKSMITDFIYQYREQVFLEEYGLTVSSYAWNDYEIVEPNPYPTFIMKFTSLQGLSEDFDVSPVVVNIIGSEGTMISQTLNEPVFISYGNYVQYRLEGHPMVDEEKLYIHVTITVDETEIELKLSTVVDVTY